MRTDELTQVALTAGEILLRSGAEIYRVEDTVIKIFESYGKECECFALLTGIFITAKEENGSTMTHIKRIKGHSFDLQRIEMLNSFSRGLQEKRLSFSEAEKVLDGIQNTKDYRFSIKLAAGGITAFLYTLIFNGSIKDGLAAFIIGIIVFLFKSRLSRAGFFPFFEFLISGAIVGSVSIIAVGTFPVLNIYKIIIGGTMILLPGMAITSGIKDALYGDVISSLYRLTEAMFTAIAIGVGVGIVLSIGLRWI